VKRRVSRVPYAPSGNNRIGRRRKRRRRHSTDLSMNISKNVKFEVLTAKTAKSVLLLSPA
jgi:hypothetical protein